MKYTVFFQCRVSREMVVDVIVKVFATSASVAVRVAQQKMLDTFGPGKPALGFKVIATDAERASNNN